MPLDPTSHLNMRSIVFPGETRLYSSTLLSWVNSALCSGNNAAYWSIMYTSEQLLCVCARVCVCVWVCVLPSQERYAYVACSHVLPPWQRGSCHSCEASLHFSLEPDVLGCAPRGASPHPGTCTSAKKQHKHTDADQVIRSQTGLLHSEQWWSDFISSRGRLCIKAGRPRQNVGNPYAHLVHLVTCVTPTSEKRRRRWNKGFKKRCHFALQRRRPPHTLRKKST